MGVREYDPALGRFDAVDPLRGISANPQTRNRYEYGLNNPSRYYDLNGLFPGENILRSIPDIPGAVYDIGKSLIHRSLGIEPEGRPDDDRELTWTEATDWYRQQPANDCSSNNRDLHVDLEKIDLSGISVDEFPDGVGSTRFGINLLTHGNIDQGIVYGKLDLTYLGDSRVMVAPNKFNFDRPGIGTTLGRTVAGQGFEYTIYFEGVGYIGD